MSKIILTLFLVTIFWNHVKSEDYYDDYVISFNDEGNCDDVEVVYLPYEKIYNIIDFLKKISTTTERQISYSTQGSTERVTEEMTTPTTQKYETTITTTTIKNVEVETTTAAETTTSFKPTEKQEDEGPVEDVNNNDAEIGNLNEKK